MSNDDDRLLMSDSLKGMVPALEEDISQFEDAFIIVLIEHCLNNNSEVIVGNLVGILLENSIIKVDLRVSILKCYDFFARFKEGKLISSAMQLQLVNKNIDIIGPFQITSPKMSDFDHQNKMCVLGIDLVRV